MTKTACLESAFVKEERGITRKYPEPDAGLPRLPARCPWQTEEARMWLSLFGIVLVLSLGFGLGSMLADKFERDLPS